MYDVYSKHWVSSGWSGELLLDLTSYWEDKGPSTRKVFTLCLLGKSRESCESIKQTLVESGCNDVSPGEKIKFLPKRWVWGQARTQDCVLLCAHVWGLRVNMCWGRNKGLSEWQEQKLCWVPQDCSFNQLKCNNLCLSVQICSVSSRLWLWVFESIV